MSRWLSQFVSHCSIAASIRAQARQPYSGPHVACEPECARKSAHFRLHHPQMSDLNYSTGLEADGMGQTAHAQQTQWKWHIGATAAAAFTFEFVNSIFFCDFISRTNGVFSVSSLPESLPLRAERATSGFDRWGTRNEVFCHQV